MFSLNYFLKLFTIHVFCKQFLKHSSYVSIIIRFHFCIFGIIEDFSFITILAISDLPTQKNEDNAGRTKKSSEGLQN